MGLLSCEAPALSAMLNGPDLRRERHAGGGGGQSNRKSCEIWLSSNLILLIFTCHILKAFDATSWWPWTKKLGDGFKMSKKYQCYLNAECQTLWQTCDKFTPDTPSPHRVSSSITFWSFLWLFSQFLRNSKGNFVLICTSKLCMCQ